MASCQTCGESFADAVFCPRDGARLAEDLGSGRVIDGRYQLIREVGAGSMGVVYEAEHLQLHRKVAVKLLRHHLAGNPEAVRRLQREAQLTSDLGHPNIVQCRDFGTTSDGRVYMVMEWLDGETLEDRLDREGVDVPTAVDIAVQTCAALAEAHACDVVHRDLKPANLFLTRDRSGDLRVKVLDFGIAKLIEAQVALTATGVVVGTPNYMSPQQALGEPIDARSDLYSLGVMLYEMLTGEVPFRGDSMLSVLHQHSVRLPVAPSISAPERGVSLRLEAVVMRCLEKRPADRFGSARELGAALERSSGASASDVAAPRPAPRDGSPRIGGEPDTGPPGLRRRSRIRRALLAAIALVSVATILFARCANRSRREREARPVASATASPGPGHDAARVGDTGLVIADAGMPAADGPEPVDDSRVMRPVPCSSRFFTCSATMPVSPQSGRTFEVGLVLASKTDAHGDLAAAGRLAGRIEIKDIATHRIVHEGTAAFDAKGRWTITVRMERAMSYHAHVDLLDRGRQFDSALLPDLVVAPP